MAYTIVFRQKYVFILFCCHSVFFGCPYRCAVKRLENCLDHCVIPRTTCLTTGGPDVVFDFGDYVMSSADKTMYENTLNIALNRTY